MGFNFNFLKDANKEKEVAKKAFHFLSSAVPGVQQSRTVQSKLKSYRDEIEANPQIKRAIMSKPETAVMYNKLQKDAEAENLYNPAVTIRDAATSVGRSLARVPETVVRSTAQAGLDLAGKVSGTEAPDLSADVTDPIRKTLYGSEPVQTYQKRTKGNKEVIEGSRFRGAAGPLSFLAAAGTIAGDVTVGGGAKKELGEQAIEKLIAKEATEAGVKKILKDKVAPEVIDRVAPSLVTATDSNAVRNILTKATQGAEAPTVIARTPMESKELVDQVKRGKLQANVDTAPISSLKLGADTEGEIDSKQVAKYVSDIKAGKTLDPVIIDSKGFVQDGKHRLAAMKQLGVKEVPVVEQVAPKIQRVVSDITPVTKVPKKPSAEQDKFIKEYAQTLKSMDQGVTGGQLVPGADGTVKRISEHSPFYSKTFKETGRKPTEAQWLEEAKRQLEDGSAGFGASDAYKQIVPGGKQRKFLKTVADSGTSTDELSGAVKGVSPQSYAQRSNPELFQTAKNQIGDDPEGALEYIKNVDRVSDEDVAMGQILMQKFQKEGRVNDAIDVVETLDTKLRESGRAVQAAALWDRLSPEGVLKLAERKIGKARRGAKNAGREGDVAREIQGKVEGAVRIDKTDVDKVVKELADPETELSVGEQLAKNVDKAAQPPKVKKKADELVAELTKKVKQEYLDPKVKTKKSPTALLREVFGRSDEADEAYPLAQEILFDKYQGDEVMTNALTKFFQSELKLPAADSTINRAIKEQLKTNGTKVSEIIHKSFSGQKQSVDDIAASLVKEGFDEASAKKLATEATTRLNKQLGEAKASVLARYAEDAKPKNQSTYLDKLNKLSNLGALDNKDYLQIARAKLDLPQLTPEIASKLTKLSQKVQDLPVDSPERFTTIREIGEQIREAAPPPPDSLAKQLFSSPKALLASYDISGAGRQGGALGTRFGKELKDSFGKQLEFFASEDKFNRRMAEIAADPRAELMTRADLALTGIREFGRVEEAFPASLAEKIPGVGIGVQASDRAYTGMLTDLRASAFNHIMDDLERSGVDIAKMSDEHLQSIGKYINTFSGRGTGKVDGWFEKSAGTLGDALFSPRLWKSRLDVLNPKFYYDLKGPARKYALQNAASFASTAAVILGLASLAGATVETDARSSDFLKIKVGDTRYDILGGFQQNLVFAWRQITGEKKSSMTGKTTKFGRSLADVVTGKSKEEAGVAKGFGGTTDRFSILTDLIQNKENPALAAGSELLKGKDKAGNDVNPVDVGLDSITPLSVQDTISQGRKEGVVGVAKSLPGYIGFGSQSYGLKDVNITEKQKDYIKKLTDAGKPKEEIEANQRFFQTLKTGPDRAKTSEEINKALEAKDKAKAQQIASDYNKQLAESFKEWKSKYGKYSNKDLVKKYNSTKIKLDSGNIKSRLNRKETL